MTSPKDPHEEEIEKIQYLSYDIIPTETRQRVFFVISENSYKLKQNWPHSDYVKNGDLPHLRHEICKYKGVPHIFIGYCDNGAISKWARTCSIEDFLKIIELFINIKLLDQTPNFQTRLDRTITDINDIFKLDRIGYEIVNRKIIKKESEYLHTEVIKQTLTLLYTNDFNGPLKEFQKALDHYAKKEYEDTVNEAAKSFESAMKSVLTNLNITFTPNDAAQKLINRLTAKNIIDSYTNNIFTGLPTIRNKLSGHGDGLIPIVVNSSYAEFSLNLAGSLIVFLIKRYQENRS